MTSSEPWVALTYRFTPGWPWPESSWGLDPMYGPDGWCHGCGTPLREQAGALVLQGRKFPTAPVWIPNWQFNCVCVSAEVADQVDRRFGVPMLEVLKPRGVATGARQLLFKVSNEDWYDPEHLGAAVRAQHPGEGIGATCSTCERWRWLPILEGTVPIVRASLDESDHVVASRETFGDGWNTFRHLLFRRELGELLAESAPRMLSVVEIQSNN